MNIFFRKLFRSKDFQFDDKVSWDLEQEDAQKLAKEFGLGPFRIRGTFLLEGCSCGAGPGERHLGRNCIPANIRAGHDFAFSLVDETGKGLRRHLHLMEFSGNLLKLV